VPTLADLDDPRRPRWRGLLWGTALAIPVTGVFVALLPRLVGALLGGASSFDARLDRQDATIAELCASPDASPLRANLCQCAAAAERPALDCVGPFHHWAVVTQAARCTGDPAMSAATSFCACVEALVLRGTDGDEAWGRYPHCEALADYPGLPSYR